MGLFTAKSAKASAVLIDIDASSIGAALAQFENGKPTIFYTDRASIKIHEHENTSEAMVRTLEEVCTDLVAKGAPILRQNTGSGHIQKVLVSVGAPWQKAQVRYETIQQTKSFIFTKALLAETARKPLEIPEGYIKSDETVIATLLNGYEMVQPFGKRATKAELIILTSLLQKDISQLIEKTLRKTYHTHALTITSFAPIAFTTFRDIFVHEKDFLVVHVSGERSEIAFIKRGLLVDIVSTDEGITDLLEDVKGARNVSIPIGGLEKSVNILDASRNSQYEINVKAAEKEWLDKMRDTFSKLSMHRALPRTLFVLADDASRGYLAKLLDSPELRTLWLTDEPLRVVPLDQSHIAPFLQIRDGAESDLSLSLMALYGAKTTHGDE